MTVEQDQAKVKKDVDLMIDWRKRNRPHDTSDIRVNASPRTMHKALYPGVALDRPSETPYHCLYRGFRVVSIPGEGAAKPAAGRARSGSR